MCTDGDDTTPFAEIYVSTGNKNHRIELLSAVIGTDRARGNPEDNATGLSGRAFTCYGVALTGPKIGIAGLGRAFIIIGTYSRALFPALHLMT